METVEVPEKLDVSPLMLQITALAAHLKHLRGEVEDAQLLVAQAAEGLCKILGIDPQERD